MAVWRGSKKLDSGKRQSHRKVVLTDIEEIKKPVDIKQREEPPPNTEPRARVYRLKILPFRKREIRSRERQMGWTNE